MEIKGGGKLSRLGLLVIVAEKLDRVGPIAKSPQQLHVATRNVVVVVIVVVVEILLFGIACFLLIDDHYFSSWSDNGDMMRSIFTFRRIMRRPLSPFPPLPQSPFGNSNAVR